MFVLNTFQHSIPSLGRQTQPLLCVSFNSKQSFHQSNCSWHPLRITPSMCSLRVSLETAMQQAWDYGTWLLSCIALPRKIKECRNGDQDCNPPPKDSNCWFSTWDFQWLMDYFCTARKDKELKQIILLWAYVYSCWEVAKLKSNLKITTSPKTFCKDSARRPCDIFLRLS